MDVKVAVFWRSRPQGCIVISGEDKIANNFGCKNRLRWRFSIGEMIGSMGRCTGSGIKSADNEVSDPLEK
jgi:hypothetical protein